MVYVPAADVPASATIKCDSIAYQFAGQMQAETALIVASAHDRGILQVSANAANILQRPGEPETLLNQTLTSALLALPANSIEPLLAQQNETGNANLATIQSGPNRFLSARHTFSNDLHLLELELENSDTTVPLSGFHELIANLLLELDDVNDIQSASQIVCQRLREHLGFDSSHLYQFDEDWHGEVIAEALEKPNLQSYLGLRFPATDIPRGAREIYKTVPLRHLSDNHSPPSPLVPQKLPTTNGHLDMTHVRGRDSASECVEFYQNMGVRSTLVLPLIVNKNTWGHLSLWHSSPRRVSPIHDLSLIAVARILASTIGRIEMEHHAASERRALEVQVELSQKIKPDESVTEHVEQAIQSLLSLLNADAIRLHVADACFHSGSPISAELSRALLRTLAKPHNGQCVSSNRIAIDYPDLAPLVEDYAGLMAFPLSEDWKDNLLLLRKAKPLQTKWAGNPSAGITQTEDDPPQKTPRHSFHTYLAETRFSAVPWTREELLIARSCTLMLALQYLRERAQAAARTQTDFLANMSHEIRTPMTAIVGFAELLKDPSTDRNDIQDLADTIHKQADHLLTVVSDILDISKIREGKLRVERRSIDPNAIFRDAVELFRAKAQSRKVNLRFESLGDATGQFYSDETRLRQIVYNLISNAIKFTEEGTVTVRGEILADGRSGRLTVTDTGVGMTKDQLDAAREFNYFFQADASTTRRFGGTGLGLAISNGLALLLGGEIDIQSRLGEGSSFTLTFPNMNPGASASSSHNPVDSPANYSATTPDAPSQYDPARLHNARVLVVEDGTDNQRLLNHVLSKAGAKVQLAENGQIALDAITEAPHGFDLILMDMQMPVMDGYTATRELRSRGCKLPILALPAHSLSEQREQCLEAGCNDYQSKPFRFQALLNSCAALLKHRHTERSTNASPLTTQS